MIAIAAVLAWGTFYEARFGTAAVQRFIYHSGWFQLLLGFLAVNLAVAAFDRYPWKRRHLPFVLAHLGIILLLAGGVLSGRLGVEGQLIIPEGESSHTLRMEQKILEVRQPNPGIDRILPVEFESTAWNHEPNQTFSLPTGHSRLELTVDRYYPDAVLEENVRPDGAAVNPAVRLRLERDGQQEEVWLFSRDPGRFGAQWAQVHTLFLEVRDPRELLRLPPQKIPPNSILLMRTQKDGRLFALLTGEKGKVQRMGPIEIEKSYGHPWAPIQFTVMEFVPNARLEQTFSPRGSEVRNEILRVVGRQNGRVEQAWLRLSEPATLPLGAHPVVVEYRNARRELPFEVKLLDFRKTDYPGTQMAAGFESDVEVRDPQRRLIFTRTIRMNQPLKYRGYSLFQASFFSEPVETTVLAVRKDPGTPLVYGGFLIVLSGIVTLFMSREKR